MHFKATVVTKIKLHQALRGYKEAFRRKKDHQGELQGTLQSILLFCIVDCKKNYVKDKLKCKQSCNYLYINESLNKVVGGRFFWITF